MQKLEKIYLHSTMLLLYLQPDGKISFKASFTFHYASTISLNQGSGTARRLHLHSTLLLLYRSRLSGTQGCVSDLHSTMLLLYPWRICSLIASCSIYIPLCFYYIRVHTQTSVHEYLIYIPLCFYYILGCRVDIQHKLNLHSTMLLLYQYVDEDAERSDVDLHSTMLLLYQYLEINRVLHSIIYIPLCFYYIDMGE